jgi:peptide/nickel transport system substrate-binding protein
MKVVTRNTSVTLKGMEPKHSPIYDDSLRGHTYDLNAAKQAYAESKHSGPLTFSLIQRDTDVQIAELVQAMLKRVGIEIKIEVLERLAWFQKVLAGNFEMGMTRSPLQRSDYGVRYIASYGRHGTARYGRMNDEKLFDLVEQSQRELDPAKRKALFVAIQQHVLDQYYQAFLFWDPTREVASKKLHNIAHDGTSIWVYSGMWLEA